jgi:hypothetical protein
MSILQPDQRDDELPSRVFASSETQVDRLPPPQRPHGTSESVSVLLWSLLLLVGVLTLLARGPLNAPPFEHLTQYVCDPLPSLPRLGNRSQQYRLHLACRAGDQVVYQSQAVTDGSNPNGLRSCKREGGLTRIWRMAPPDAYGATVFHATCGNHIIVLYKNRAANYESNQRFIIALAFAIITLSTVSLLMKWFRRERRVNETDNMPRGA